MSWFSPQNPGIGGIDELTNAEEIFLTTLAGLSFSEGDVLKIVSGAPAWSVVAGGSGITRTITITGGSATMGSTALTDYVYLVAGAHTMTLPTAIGNTNLYIVKNNHSANITIDTTSAQTVDGDLTISLAPEEAVGIISTNTNWNIV